MALNPGDRIAQYEVQGLLGSGGMGEVYLARDTELGREVAIKIVRDDVVHGSIKSRLQREARVLASLNHPNVATLYGLEQEAGQSLLVMEVVAGGSLAERLEGGPLSSSQTIAVFAQVADALASAHSAGVVHRDLKPSNICLSEDDQVKVLDFGLAKDPRGVGRAESSGETSQMSTLTHLTQAGQVLGTAGYVSPEGATGQPVDWRSDIWAFGCCLYECLVGDRPFEGRSVQETLGAVVTRDPCWAKLPRDLDPGLATIIRRCLEKDPRRRLQSLADARIQLLEVASPPASIAPQERTAALPAAARRGGVSVTRAAIGVGLLLATGFLLRDLYSASSEQTTAPVHLSFQVPGNIPLRTVSDSPNVQVSREGDQVFLLAGRGRHRQIYRRSLASSDLVPIPGTSGADDLAFAPSPDGAELAFVRDGRLQRLLIDGGIATEIAKISTIDPDFFSCFWADDGQIYFTFGNAGNWTIHRVSRDGGVPERLSKLDTRRGEIGHTDPFVLPGAEVLLYSAKQRSAQHSDIWMLRLATGETSLLVEDGHHPVVTSTGHLVFSRGATIFAAALDSRKRTVGRTVPVAAAVESAALARAALFSISEGGTLAYVKQGQIYNRRLAWLDRDGATSYLGVEADRYHSVGLSRDGAWATLGRLAVGDVVREDLVIVALERVRREILLSDGSINNYPLFSPDGSEVAYTSNSEGQWNLFTVSVSGDQEPRRLTTSTMIQEPVSWSPDGRYLAYREDFGDGKTDLFALPLRGDELPIPISVVPEHFEASASFSPDGRWVAYSSDRDGRQEVYAKPFPASPGQRPIKVSVNGGWYPVWSSKGDELFFRDLEGSAVMAVAVSPGSSPRFGAPRVLFEDQQMYLPGPFREPDFDVAPDGRFIALVTDESSSTTVEVIQNWLKVLEEHVPSS